MKFHPPQKKARCLADLLREWPGISPPIVIATNPAAMRIAA
jgi:hypothetical protein